MNFRYILVSLLALAVSNQTYAEGNGRWFDVEVLVFKRNVDIQDLTEQLDQHNVYLKQRERLEVLKAEATNRCDENNNCLHQQNPVIIGNEQMQLRGHRLQRLDSSHLELVEQRERLEKHELFEPLMHVVWRMPIQNKQKALPIHLFAGKNYAIEMFDKQQIEEVNSTADTATISTVSSASLSTESSSALTTESEPKLDVLAALEKDNTLQDQFEIDGNFLIYVERYLFIDSQLIVRTETNKAVNTDSIQQVETQTVSDTQISSAAVQTFNQQPVEQEAIETEVVVTETLFDQSRRLRSEEIHYLDHPLFGIIVQIRKIPEDQLPQ